MFPSCFERSICACNSFVCSALTRHRSTTRDHCLESQAAGGAINHEFESAGVLSPPSCSGFACPTPSEALPCSKGFYCPPGTPDPESYPCPKGTYGDRPGMTSAETCTPCPRGFFCDVPGGEPVPCPRGFYCATQGLTRTGMMPCPLGTYGIK
ncbi:zonadhesin family protein [Cystoisospora suis]|uniref:Zonadhesin family protein n=1 Tax=Cystoisospora suis TaxID=483139 RepID=A0A2C6KU71_9APIC|nr:zonadhesin family protein [Cystoisospora suis]